MSHVQHDEATDKVIISEDGWALPPINGQPATGPDALGRLRFNNFEQVLQVSAASDVITARTFVNYINGLQLDSTLDLASSAATNQPSRPADSSRGIDHLFGEPTNSGPPRQQPGRSAAPGSEPTPWYRGDLSPQATIGVIIAAVVIVVVILVAIANGGDSGGSDDIPDRPREQQPERPPSPGEAFTLDKPVNAFADGRIFCEYFNGHQMTILVRYPRTAVVLN